MISDETLFHSKNLLLNSSDPSADLTAGGYYGNFNNGIWCEYAKLRECTLPNNIFVPFFHSIDWLLVDKYRNLMVEAVLIYCLCYGRKTHNNYPVGL